MNWIRFGLMAGLVGMIVVLMTACESAEAVLATPTVVMMPTPIVQATPVPPSPTPIKSPTSLSTLPTATVPSSRTTVPAVTLTATPSPKDMLMAAFAKALAGLKTYRVEVPEEGRYIAVKLPDAVLQEGADYILKIGSTVWSYSASGSVRVSRNASVPFLDRANLNWLRTEFSKSPQIVLLGPGTAEGVPCIGYSGNFTVTKISPPKTPGGQSEITQVPQVVKIWFATGDGFPRRIEMGAPTAITMNFFDFNEPIDIQPPQ